VECENIEEQVIFSFVAVFNITKNRKLLVKRFYGFVLWRIPHHFERKVKLPQHLISLQK
jgi:hypothetical protein